VAAVKAMIGKLGLERTLQGRSGVDKRVRNLIAHFGDCERRFHTMVSAHFI